MPAQMRTLGKAAVLVIATAAVIGLSWAFLHFRRSEKGHGEKPKPIVATLVDPNRVLQEKLDLPAETIKAFRLKTSLAKTPKFSRVLHLRGSLAIDSNRLSHVHARFPGTIIELATVKGLKSQMDDASSPARTLQNFDEVEKGTPLAVIWSKDLGEKKSLLASSIAQLRLDKQTLERFKALTATGSISDRELREQKSKVEQGEITVFTAEATLRAYQLTDVEIKEVRDSADKIHLNQETDKSYTSDWPRVVVKAPIGGVIVDKAVTVGEIVDANDELFKVADLNTLTVWLHPYEEDLAVLEELPKPLKVTITIPGNESIGEIECEIDRFSPMIDPNEHMALLIGTVKNPGRKLLVNQFIKADVGIPAEGGVVEIPVDALIDVANDAIVFVRPEGSDSSFHRRKVSVVQRYFDVVYVRSELTDEQKKNGLQPIHIDDAVVAGGLLELEDYLQQR
jgi:cobalt-zinc-cadmium efflux system membrane fusion protein